MVTCTLSLQIQYYREMHYDLIFSPLTGVQFIQADAVAAADSADYPLQSFKELHTWMGKCSLVSCHYRFNITDKCIMIQFSSLGRVFILVGAAAADSGRLSTSELSARHFFHLRSVFKEIHAFVKYLRGSPPFTCHCTELSCFHC